MAYDSRTLIKALKKAGWRHIRTAGSHRIFSREGDAALVVVPHPRKDIPKGTYCSIRTTAGLD
ncbi:MAG: putative RNA binding protein YcfA (HicA-like mRNA interferase family) [Myxococcota bacterium]|jgi:predicted RNA binding protein YcfA (HicA-like mRNA interferase family)